jgi:uncharacterized protein
MTRKNYYFMLFLPRISYFVTLNSIHMTLQQTIKSQIIEAMKARDAIRLETLRGLSSQMTNELVALKRTPQAELSDEEALTVIRRAVKQRKDSIEQFNTALRPELAEKESAELSILEVYLPQMMSKDEVMQIAMAKKAELGVETKADALNSGTTGVGRPANAGLAGKLMSTLMKDLKGKADGSTVKEVVDELLK